MPRKAQTTLSITGAIIIIGVGLAGSAQAASIAVTAAPNPAHWGTTITLTNTGATNQTPTESSSLIYDYYEPNVAPCAPTAADARNRSHGDGYIATLEQNPSAAFEDQTTFTPKSGAFSYRICAYLYSGGDDSVVPDAVASTVLTIAPTRAELVARAVKKCHKKPRSRRAKCIRLAKRLYATH